MISAEELAKGHSSFWEQALPMNDSFVRFVNLKYARFAAPLLSNVATKRRAFVAELGFGVFRDWLTGPDQIESLSSPTVEKARRRIAALSGSVEEIQGPS